ncbi:hypothetical protein ACJRO7_015307 [Eucalyptus globulus]|uniref:CCHC-type domain-containing protein n=1 Tax=Eucalyptus globulus TaxID=34317 RepID=A0ABD3L437_EUCGL
MDNQYVEERRIADLCKSLGDLWSEDDVVDIPGEIPEENLIACRKTLYGKFFNKPNVNFTAFISTMKKAWRNDNVTCAVIEPGYYSFSFPSEAEKQRILDAGPWSFSSNLLVLKQCDPDTPDVCYDFNHCDFWVNLFGLPFGRVTYAVVQEIASKIGDVVEVKLEAKGNSTYKVGRARVKINLENPLKTGVLVNLDNKSLWVEFKYERLPHYCYSCGKIGHYATTCKEIPYEETGLAANLPGRFGHWLRAEARELSPYGKIFYGKQEFQQEGEESVPETPILPVPETEQQQHDKHMQKTQQMGVLDSAENSRSKECNHTFPSPALTLEEKGPQKRGSSCIDEESVMVIYEEQMKEIEAEMADQSAGRGLNRDKTKSAKLSSSKKGKRFCPYGAQTSKAATVDNTQLVDTPIRVVNKSEQWALVASPNKPPNHP